MSRFYQMVIDHLSQTCNLQAISILTTTLYTRVQWVTLEPDPYTRYGQAKSVATAWQVSTSTTSPVIPAKGTNHLPLFENSAFQWIPPYQTTVFYGILHTFLLPSKSWMGPVFEQDMSEDCKPYPMLLLLFTHIQHIVRTYDSRQSCLWSAEERDQMKKHHEAHT